jgi:hypothetical protein
MSKPKAKKQTIELPDVMASELVRIINTAHEDGKLITGFVAILEMFDGKKKTIKITANADMPQHSVFGIINFAAEKYQFTIAPDEDDDEDDFYNPNWYEGQ